MGPSTRLDLRVVIGLSLALVVGCVATWVVMDMRLRREREAMRDELRQELQQVQQAVKGEIKGAAAEVLSADYAEKRVLEEAGRLLGDSSGKEPGQTPSNLADAGVKLSTKAAADTLKAIKDNEKQIGEVKDAATDVARTGIRALLEAAKSLVGEVTPEQEMEPGLSFPRRETHQDEDVGDSEELPEPPKERK